MEPHKLTNCLIRFLETFLVWSGLMLKQILVPAAPGLFLMLLETVILFKKLSTELKNTGKIQVFMLPFTCGKQSLEQDTTVDKLLLNSYGMHTMTAVPLSLISVLLEDGHALISNNLLETQLCVELEWILTFIDHSQIPNYLWRILSSYSRQNI